MSYLIYLFYFFSMLLLSPNPLIASDNVINNESSNDVIVLSNPQKDEDLGSIKDRMDNIDQKETDHWNEMNKEKKEVAKESIIKQRLLAPKSYWKPIMINKFQSTLQNIYYDSYKIFKSGDYKDCKSIEDFLVIFSKDMVELVVNITTFLRNWITKIFKEAGVTSTNLP